MKEGSARRCAPRTSTARRSPSPARGTREEEARSIGEEIEQLQRGGNDGKPHLLDQIAILVRASYQMREFEDRFVTLGLPYRVIGGPRFYERAEIRDALAYLRVINSPADDLAFERIVNVPKRGLGDATVQAMHDLARKRRVPLTEAARLIVESDELKPKPRGTLRGLMESFERWRKQKDTLPHTELAELVLDESGYTEMWQKDRSADAAGRLENLKELVRSMEEFENLAGFLEHISLVMDVDRGEAEDAVNVMTLHAAKGLEFDTVFLPGWEEGLFPSQRTLDDQGRAGLEEERRLGHVGLTRARKRAKIFFATNRRTHGMWTTNIPSRFLDELPAANVEVTESKGSFGGAAGYGASRFDKMTAFGSNYSTPGWQRAQANKSRGGFSENGTPRYGEGGVGDDSLDYVQAGLRRGLRPHLARAREARAKREARRRAGHHRRRADREIDRHGVGLRDRRPGVPPEVRQRQRHRDRRQQADDCVRQGGRKARGGQLRRKGVRRGTRDEDHHACLHHRYFADRRRRRDTEFERGRPDGHSSSVLPCHAGRGTS